VAVLARTIQNEIIPRLMVRAKTATVEVVRAAVMGA